MITYDKNFQAQLYAAFHAEMVWLMRRIDQDGWVWTSNILRELVRSKHGLKFTNTISPDLLRMLRQRNPEMRKYIVINTRKGE